MKKIEIKTANGVITYYQDKDGNITTAKPIDGIQFRKWVVTDDPSQYALGDVYDDEQSAIEHLVKMRDFKTLYCIELSYINDDLPPQYIHIIDETGKRTRVL